MVFPFKCLTVASRLNRAFSSIHQFESENQQILHSLLEKCSSIKELKQIHAQIVLNGLNHQTLTISKVISFCAVTDTRNLDYAQLVFNQITQPNKFMYNSLIRGYSNSNEPIKSILLYRQMIDSGLSPNEFTLPFVLKACASKSAFWVSLLVYGQAQKLGLGCHVCVQNGLINAFIWCGFINFAKNVFDDMSERTLVSWNSMIGGYAKVGWCKEAFLLFKDMRETRIEPDKFTLVNLLTVCSQSCNIHLGRFLHLHIEITGLEIDLIVRNALLDMYAKCGHLQLAERLFDQMSDKNVVSWTSMISAYAKHGLVEFAQKKFDKMTMKNVVSWNSMISCHVQAGQCKEALNLFHGMHNLGVMPNESTLVCVLSACSQIGDLVTACSHCGLVDIGRDYFYKMRSVYGIVHEIEHYACMVDLLGRGGRLDEAMMLIRGMPMKPDIVIWGALLGACRTHGDVRIGKQILKQLLELKPSGSGVYVLLSNLFFEAGKWEGMKNIRKLMNNHEIIKCRGISSIEVEGCIYEFMVDDSRLEVSSNVYSLLDQLTDHMTSIGYFCNFSSVFSESHEM
ncbi:pentatricopeptide repeat-containing protein At5g48910 isoform X2 [Jatropha curcas]|uniref:pentatricopeptide repeat-containing protein At5g48910 isoform X2 n=1 Tax=Jatropha curcas TaxID=180498 RepID=UPI0009D6F6E2|nr:pentatricopeptide repeat-containing protein At5g48910 isoform X2 [Jatropha curcas]